MADKEYIEREYTCGDCIHADLCGEPILCDVCYFSALEFEREGGADND